MNRDKDIWKFMLEKERFLRFTEIKEPFQLHDYQLTKSLRRLEKSGLVVREVGFYKNRPVNTYLAIDPSDPRLGVRIVDDHGWLFAIIGWFDEKNRSGHSVSFNLGELADYIRTIDGKGYLEWPAWISTQAEAGKVNLRNSRGNFDLRTR